MVTPERPGNLDAAAVYEDGQQVGVKVLRADPLVIVHPDLLAGLLAPGVIFDGTQLTIEAVNGTWRYLLTEDGARAHGTRLARLIESPAEPPTSILSTPRVVDSPCGPVLDEHCDCCAHRYVGDHIQGQVCPCESRELG